MRIAFLTCFLLFLLSSKTQAQQSIFRSKAQKDYDKAVLYEIHRQPEDAIRYFQKSIRKSPNQTAAYQGLAALYSEQQNFKEAARTLQDCRTCTSESQLTLAAYLFRAGHYFNAQKILSDLATNKDFSKQEKEQIQLLEKSIVFAKGSVVTQPLDSGETPENLGLRVNSEYDEYFPSINLNDSVLIFTRKTNGIDQDFYLAHRDSCGGWLDANPLGSPPNSPAQEGAQMLSEDGHYLFFTRCQNQSPNGWALGGCDLYFSYDVPGGWSQPVPFGATINTPAYEGMPSLSPDNRTLYFVSDRPGGYGGKDIWMSQFEDGLWQVPKNLGPVINTAGDETAPWIATDNQTLYFTSTGHPGLGGADIYMSRKQPDGQWGKPVDLGYPINSSSDDVSMNVTNNGEDAYFASNRSGGIGGMDLYEVRLPKELRPYPRTFVYGVVRDSVTHQRLPLAIMTWTNVKTGKVIAQYESNRGDASYISPFPLNTELALSVTRYNYLDKNDTFYFEKDFVFPPDTINISLLPSDYNPPLTDTNLLIVHFNTNAFALNDSEINLIKEIVKPFKGGRYNEFVVNGFTDTSGYQAINEDISSRRANAVKDVLLNMGISEDKIRTYGWSDSNPLGSNETDAGRALNRRAVLVLERPEK